MQRNKWREISQATKKEKAKLTAKISRDKKNV